MGNILQNCVCGNHTGKLCSVIMICEAGNFLSRDAITEYHCSCSKKNKGMLYLVDIENEFSVCFHV